MEKCIWERMLDKCEKEKTILVERVEELEEAFDSLYQIKIKLTEQNEKMRSLFIRASHALRSAGVERQLWKDMVDLIAEIETKEDDNG